MFSSGRATVSGRRLGISVSDGTPAGAAVDFQTSPEQYRHWRLAVDGPVATVTLEVDPDGGLRDDYELKLNSYDLGVDIELADVVQRLRFEHPEVARRRRSPAALDKVFCAGANIQMLAGSSHHHKVNFCKFTNETRNAIEDATAALRPGVDRRRQRHRGRRRLRAGAGLRRDRPRRRPVVGRLAARGAAAGRAARHRRAHPGGRQAPRPPRPGRRVRHPRRGRARASRPSTWGLVDAVAPRSRFDEVVRERADWPGPRRSDRPADEPGVAPRRRSSVDDDGDDRRYEHVDVRHRPRRSAPPTSPSTARRAAAATPTSSSPPAPRPGCSPRAGELDDAILHLRFNEPEVGTWVLHTTRRPGRRARRRRPAARRRRHWLVREVRLYWARTLKRLDLSARTLVALIEPGSCFAGTLAELVLAADRSFMLDGPTPTATARRPRSS